MDAKFFILLAIGNVLGVLIYNFIKDKLKNK